MLTSSLFMTFGWLVIGTISFQVPNVLGMQQGGELTIFEAFRITIITSPLILLGSMAFTLFFAHGISFATYPTLNIAAKVVGLIVAALVQVWFLNKSDFNIVEGIGILIAVVGIFIAAFSKNISEYIESKKETTTRVATQKL